MATKTAKNAGKSKGSSNRGGARPGAGRKPKPIEEMRTALNVALIAPVERIADAATAALALLRDLMDDPDVAPKDRIAAARELLNRSLGRPREAAPIRDEAEDEERVHIYLPDNGRDSGVAS
ncbi:hypothetical protein P12x_003066 [Tundrisphaera lichenicola]|uniref:hypothetical protein n=1 Tax=Tundrisphaera lichenicola TaxID=2029860 RepID=UPI003EBFEE42